MSDPAAAAHEALLDHVTEHIGTVEGIIDVPTPLGAVGVMHVAPTESKPWHALITSGLSSAPMTLPEDVDDVPRLAELMVALPPDWPVDGAGLSRPATAWPIRVLASIATFPAQSGSWLGPGHTLPNGDPPQPFVNGLDFCGVLIAPALTVPPEARHFNGPFGAVGLYGLVPVFAREMEFKLEQGAPALLHRFDEKGVNELLEVRRPAVAGILIELLDTKSET